MSGTPRHASFSSAKSQDLGSSNRLHHSQSESGSFNGFDQEEHRGGSEDSRGSGIRRDKSLGSLLHVFNHPHPSSVHLDRSRRDATLGWSFLDYPTDSAEYDLIDEIGKGATASVWLARCEEVNAEVAIKIVKLDDPNIHLPSIVAEVNTMKQLQHPNILPLYASFVEDDQLWMVMPYVAGGAALDIMQRQHSNGLNEHVIATIMKNVLQALAYLHKDGYIHRDLKAGNILIDHKGKVILADMGVTAAMARTHRLHDSQDAEKGRNSANGMSAYLSRTTFAGTPCWMAPEVMEDGIEYNCAADIWSFGITLLEFALGAAPLADFSLDQILMKTLNEPAPVLESTDRRKKFTEDMQDLVSKCVQKDPADRRTAAELLKHKFWKMAYDGSYLVKQLDIGTGAALGASDGGGSRGKGAAGIAKSGVLRVVRGITDKTVTGEDIDATDSFKLLRRLTLPKTWQQDDDAEPLDTGDVRRAKGLAFGMLHSHGRGVKILRGSGFVIGRCPNHRREMRWSAPSYFTIDIRSLPPHLASMEQVHLVIVLANEESLQKMWEPECSFEPPQDEDDDPQEEHSSQRRQVRRLSSFIKRGVSSLPILGNRLPSDANSLTSSGGGSASVPDGSRRDSQYQAPRGMPTVAYALEIGTQRPITLPLAGATVKVDTEQNARLYGANTPVQDILQIKKTKRPPAFDRLVRDLEGLVESRAPAPDDGVAWKTDYFQT